MSVLSREEFKTAVAAYGEVDWRMGMADGLSPTMKEESNLLWDKLNSHDEAQRQRIAELEAKLAESEALNRRMLCTYCGHIDSTEGLTGIEIRDRIAAHIVTCEKHPAKSMVESLAAALKERDEAREAFDEIHHSAGLGFPSWAEGQSAAANAKEVVECLASLRLRVLDARSAVFALTVKNPKGESEQEPYPAGLARGLANALAVIDAAMASSSRKREGTGEPK